MKQFIIWVIISILIIASIVIYVNYFQDNLSWHDWMSLPKYNERRFAVVPWIHEYFIRRNGYPIMQAKWIYGDKIEEYRIDTVEYQRFANRKVK